MRLLILIIFILLFLISNKKKENFLLENEKETIKNSILNSITNNAFNDEEYTTIIDLVQDYSLGLEFPNENLITLNGIDINELINFLKFKIFRQIIRFISTKDYNKVKEYEDKLDDNQYGAEIIGFPYFGNKFIKIQNKLDDILDDNFTVGKEVFNNLGTFIREMNTNDIKSDYIRDNGYEFADGTIIVTFLIGSESIENKLNEFIIGLPSINRIIDIILNEFYCEIIEIC
tara:strand:+ start:205 stop:897 length:693 start_codon:yes stop_codon:yes gene_type:complete